MEEPMDTPPFEADTPPRTYEPFKLKTKIEDMMKYGKKAVASFPRRERQTADEIRASMLRMYRLALQVERKYYRKTTMQEMDVEIMKLRAYVRLSFQLGFLPPKKYEVWSAKLVEIGKMLGGWIKAVNGSKVHLT